MDVSSISPLIQKKKGEGFTYLRGGNRIIVENAKKRESTFAVPIQRAPRLRRGREKRTEQALERRTESFGR